MRDITYWQLRFDQFFETQSFSDASHDPYHFKRVWKLAQKLMETEPTMDTLTVLASCYFHDIISFEKNDPRRAKSSTFAALKAVEILKEMAFPSEKLEPVAHAIKAHSFSARITPETIEAKIVQDADRMEALGAIGLARCFYTAGRLNTQLFHPADPLAEQRDLDDKTYALDHFKIKLLRLPETMQTESGKQIARKRAEILSRFMDDILSELAI